MPFMPFQILGLWFRGLLAIAILAGGIYLLTRWYDHAHVAEPAAPVASEAPPRADPDRPAEAAAAAPARRVFRFDPGWNRPTAELAAAVALLAWATLGQLVGRGASTLTLRAGSKPGRGSAAGSGHPGEGEPDEDPRDERTGQAHEIRRPDGSVLRVETYGPADAPPIVWTHGWGADSTEWFYQKRHLAGRFRLIAWDEPGLGLSKQPDNKDYRLETFAANLAAVLEFAGDRPAVLVGHSIGGMAVLTFCKVYPDLLARRVAGLVLVHTTYTNPVRTTRMAGLYTAIEKPVLIPLMHLTIATWPLVWLMDWMGYLNGSAHRSTHRSSFAGGETRGQLDFCARYMAKARPDVLARGMLGMIGYDATEALGRVGVPTLVVVGDKDTTTLPEAGRFIADRVPGAELATLSPARHMGLIEHHGRFDGLVADFAARCQPAGVGR